jgi:hypothetical protein
MAMLMWLACSFGSLLVARQPLAFVGRLSTMFNSIDPPLSAQMKIPGRTHPGLSRIMQFVSGRFVLKDAIVTVTASDGRTTMGVIEDSMLSRETLAALRPMPPTFRSC